MLTELRITNMGVIETLELMISDGLTALTGETGAGKTMLVEAISLLVGGRADAAIVRPGCTEATIAGRFVLDDEELVVERIVPADGRSRAYVNGRLATAAQLATLGARSVDLHGQHAHQSLLVGAHQREALDRFAGTDLSVLRMARGRLTEIDAALAALGGDARTRMREIDLLRYQVAELSDAAIDGADEDERLLAEQDTLADAGAHRDAGLRSAALLGDDGGVLDELASATAALQERTPYHATVERMQAILAELDDAVGELRVVAERIDEDPGRLAVVGQRRAQLADLRRKYGDTLAEVLDYLADASQRLAELEGYAQRVAALEGERRTAVDDERRAAAAVAGVRRAAAAPLAEAVQTRLRRLAMPHAEVVVEVGGDDPGDEVRFLLSANPGSTPLPLAKVASGGELARAMLALRLVLSEAPDTLVFDEVDAGIGGDAAAAVGAALADLAERHQVLVVTHLAQVAARARTQIVVSKRVAAGSTVAEADRVDGERRIAEVARMLSGSVAGESAARHAAELLARPAG